MIARIVAPHFVAGVDIPARRSAPIVSYMLRWPPQRIASYCASKGWRLEWLP